ncbi:hypothetical protein EDD15DRAFT_2533728 [Pisolithus albus]|nr:hypothetical protein EDD15DRAFT_2533728 [Pisolithus albus]
MSSPAPEDDDTPQSFSIFLTLYSKIKKMTAKGRMTSKEEKSTKMKELLFAAVNSNYLKFHEAILLKPGLENYTRVGVGIGGATKAQIAAEDSVDCSFCDAKEMTGCFDGIAFVMKDRNASLEIVRDASSWHERSTMTDKLVDSIANKYKLCLGLPPGSSLANPATCSLEANQELIGKNGVGVFFWKAAQSDVTMREKREELEAPIVNLTLDEEELEAWVPSTMIISAAMIAPSAEAKKKLIHTALWLWIHLLQANVSNQTYSPHEDVIYGRPLLSGRITVNETSQFRWFLFAICLCLSRRHGPGVLSASAALSLVEVLYDDLGVQLAPTTQEYLQFWQLSYV